MDEPSQLKPLLVGVNLADPLRCLVTVEGVRVISLQRERERVSSAVEVLFSDRPLWWLVCGARKQVASHTFLKGNVTLYMHSHDLQTTVQQVNNLTLRCSITALHGGNS